MPPTWPVTLLLGAPTVAQSWVGKNLVAGTNYGMVALWNVEWAVPFTNPNNSLSISIVQFWTLLDADFTFLCILHITRWHALHGSKFHLHCVSLVGNLTKQKNL